jgi:hypothetical protein
MATTSGGADQVSPPKTVAADSVKKNSASSLTGAAAASPGLTELQQLRSKTPSNENLPTTVPAAATTAVRKGIPPPTTSIVN